MGFVVVLAAVLLVLASSGSYFPFFPLAPLFFVLVLFATKSSIPRARGLAQAPPDPNAREKELLRVLERHEEVTAARAALETYLSVAEAERMLARLASGGHLEVRAHGGTLAYALRPQDRRGDEPKELEGPGDG